MTRRERKEARLARREEWAEGRDRKAAASFGRASAIADNIHLGQPILVGHHSERHARRDQARIHAGLSAGVESSRMADHHRQVADGIQHQLDTSIFTDDPDAPERLRERIAGLEDDRRRMKEINKQIRRGAGWEARLRADGLEITEAEKGQLLSVLRHQPYYCVNGLPIFPAYALQNIGGNISRLRKRLPRVDAVAAAQGELRQA